MESPSKRLKLGHAPYDDDDDDDDTNLDELSMTPTQFNARQDPLYKLDKGRAKAATRLKSAFERIFEKYERDFTGVGDEIDLETGEVVVNNGHLQSLEDENDRTREGSISSDEEERIMRGKDVKPRKGSHSNSLVRTTPQGSHTGQNQLAMANGVNHQLTPFEMPPSAPGFSNPYMFGPPMFNGPVDPLWQAPEVPIPLYQDRFGFMGQPFGYPPSFGYGYGSMLPPGGNLGNGPLRSLLRPQPPKKLHCTKTSGRKPLHRVSSASEDSEEDDILLGNNTQEITKSTATGSNKSSPVARAAKNTTPSAQENREQPKNATTDKISQKPRRPGRPKKMNVPAEPPGSNDETIEEHGESIDTTLSTRTSESAAESTTSSIATSILPQSSEEGILARQIAAKLAQARTLTRKSVESFEDQHRRSSRARKKTEFYSQITWTKVRQLKSDPVDITDTTENAADEALDLLPLDTSSSTGDIATDDPISEYISQPELSNEGVLTRAPSITLPDQGVRCDELLANRKGTDGNERPVESDPRDNASTIEDSVQRTSLFPNSEADIKEKETLLRDNETLSCSQSVNLPREKESPHTTQDSSQNVPSNHESNQKPITDSHTTEDMNIELDVRITVRDLAGNEIPGASKELRQSIFVPDGSQEERQNPPVRTEPEEATAPLSDLVQREAEEAVTLLHESVQTQPDATTLLSDPVQEETQAPEPDAVGTELQLDDAVHWPNSTELVSQSPGLPSEDETMSLPSEIAIIPIEDEQVPASKSELVMRPMMPDTLPRGEPKQATDVNEEETTSAPMNPPPQPVKVTANTPIPRTPRKRRRPAVEAEPSSSTPRSTSTKKKLSLTSLVPDDPDEDDDELSVLSSSVPSPFYNSRLNRLSTPSKHSSPASTPHKTGRRHGFLMGSKTSTPHRGGKRIPPPATDSRALGSSKRRFAGTSSAVQSSPLARSVMHFDRSDLVTATPTKWNRNGAGPEPDPMDSSLVRTPGGSARRCGEDGYVCERDFCFTCCK
ncbi:hypothetical protein F4776DRAFT_603241 [Hypoxylon sp. NC0597]|nr:hypothetical protein F4776DRAFT_603241 [Hypoxylon sp. NC0597]